MSAVPVVRRPHLHPLHALLLAFPIALFTTALAADIAYLNSAEMQWSNFAAWAITGALVIGAPVVLWAVLRLIFAIRADTFLRRLLYLLLVVIMWGSGLVNAFQHSRDAWSSVGTLGLTLSIVSTFCALVAGWIAFSSNTSTGVAR
jgi:uncharacterized membrane protein